MKNQKHVITLKKLLNDVKKQENKENKTLNSKSYI